MYKEAGPCVCPCICHSWSLDLPTFISQVQSGMVLSPWPSWPCLLKQGILLSWCLTLHQSVHFHQALLGHYHHSAHPSPLQPGSHASPAAAARHPEHTTLAPRNSPQLSAGPSSHSRHLLPLCTWYSRILLLPHLLVKPVSGTEER